MSSLHKLYFIHYIHYITLLTLLIKFNLKKYFLSTLQENFGVDLNEKFCFAAINVYWIPPKTPSGAAVDDRPASLRPLPTHLNGLFNSRIQHRKN